MEIKAGQRLIMSELSEPGGTYEILAISEGEFTGIQIASLGRADGPPRVIAVSTITYAIKLGLARIE